MIGIINLSHSDPLYMAFPAGQTVRNSAADNLKYLMAGSIEIGMISLVSYIKNRDKLKLIKSMNIHSRANTLSTLLVSKLDHLKDNMKINVTSLTKTTELYLKLVLDRMGLSYVISNSKYSDPGNLLKTADYALIIGDNAIEAYSGNLNILMDTGLEFSKQYHMYPVYAISAAANGTNVDDSMVNYLNGRIAESKKYIKDAVELNSKKFNVKEEVMKEYYRSIDYSFSEPVMKTVEFVSGLNDL
ncbi:MAG: MqnA/MqnD/SBP family protein [Ferroplasma sp.]|uniref:MqnA/MqnD/SBP family protein n=1 Tax=Ferroplasma sp. TaxID=2591003 RepID=UPI00281568F1|nr:MqnA/MqnD/SBP family protein [Ferroplasma sp.]WMT51445.1 MAG: MqnA/MqnD/SBP family protein [Ferroplasma sp.]